MSRYEREEKFPGGRTQCEQPGRHNVIRAAERLIEAALHYMQSLRRLALRALELAGRLPWFARLIFRWFLGMTRFLTSISRHRESQIVTAEETHDKCSESEPHCSA